jgi:hypothetical protein
MLWELARRWACDAPKGAAVNNMNSDERRHTLVDRLGVRESGIRLPSEMPCDCALSVAALFGLMPMGSCRTEEQRRRRPDITRWEA